MPQPDSEPRETERRRATVMFADLTGFTSLVEQAGDEEAYEIVSSCLKLLDEIARRYGATVDKYLGDCVMAVFGVPKAVENAPRAAVNAAIEIRERVEQFVRERQLARPLGVHTGINTGSLISGDVSGPVIREFAVMGDTVNIAARLKDLAPSSQIWVGPQTWRATKQDFEYARIDSLPLEGKQRSVDVFEVRSSRPSINKARPGERRDVYSELVGRERELGKLRALSAALAAGTGFIANLIGEPGLGKSRLLAELSRSTEVSELRWLEGRSLAIGRTLSYHPFQDLLRAWLGVVADTRDAEARALLEAGLAELRVEDAAELHPLLATVAGLRLDAEGRRRLAAIQGDAREKMIRRAVAQVALRLSAQRPLLLVLDDLHWADLSSVELLESLLPLCGSHPIGFLLAHRPHFEESSERVRRHARERHPGRHAEIELMPLAGQDVRRLVENLFSGSEAPLSVRKSIQEKSAGNPFFAEEVVRSLLDEGALELRGGRLVATERIHSVVIPDTVQEVVMARIDALDPESRQVLHVASVMGGAFYLRALAEVVQKERLEEILARLEELGLIVPLERLEGRFGFKHPLLQEVAYETILRSRRAELHRAVGDALETVLTENVPGYHAMLAYHFGLGRAAERSEEYLFRAGDEAARSAASNEALRFFQGAAQLYFEIHGEGGDPAKKSLLEKRVAGALFNRGRLAEAVEHFDRALAHLGDRLPHGLTRLPRVAAALARLLYRLYAGGWESLRAATDVEREIVAIRFERHLAQTTTAPEFVPDTISTEGMLTRVDPRTVPESGGILSGAIAIFSWGGISFGLGRRVLEVARGLAEAGNIQELRLYHRLMGFIHCFLEGDWSESHFVEESLIEAGLRNGRFWEATVALDIDGECALRRGDYARVERRLAQLERLASDYGNEVALATQRSISALLALERGELDSAREWVELYQREHAEHTYQIAAAGIRAQLELQCGSLEPARKSLERGEGLIRAAGLVVPFHRSFWAAPRQQLDVLELELAQRARDRTAVRSAERRARTSRRLALRVASKVAARRSEILRVAATHDWLRGRFARALAGYEHALEVGRNLGALPELARTCAEIAVRLSEPRGPDTLAGLRAQAWREEAHGRFAALGLAPESWPLTPLHS